MTPILSATGTCNFNLAKWLDKNLKPLSVNEYTITDAFEFADEIRSIPMNDEDILVSYDVTALFTDVPLSETINIRPGLLEAWLVLTSVKYHGNLYILIPLNQRLALTRLRATGLVDKAFTDDWFNQTYDLNFEKEELAQLLEVATTNQLFQFDGHLYEQTDDVAIGSPLGLLMALSLIHI